MAIDMSQFYQVFFDESAEHLAAMETLLLDLDLDNPDSEQLNAIFRAAHSIKGSASTFGFVDMAETTHTLENLLDRIRKRELDLRPDMVDVFLESGDLLRDMLASHQGHGSVDPQRIKTVCASLRQLSAGVPAEGQSEAHPAQAKEGSTQSDVVEMSASPRVFAIEFVPTEISAKEGGVESLLAELRRFGTLEVVCNPEEGSDDVGFWQLRLTTSVPQASFADQVDFIADDGAWRIFEETPATDVEPVVHGFLADLVADDEADPGYGFFASLPSATPSQQVGEEGDGYGFFVPLPAPETISTSAREPQVKATAPVTSSVDSSIRVGVEKVDQLINLVGELVITQSMLLQTVERMHENVPERLSNGLAQLERNTRDLQASVMSIRMMPISFVFSRFPRVVRDLSSKLGKQVELKTSGEATELDKGLIERIADPLTHLIRNSLDHGIELPEQRVAAGKKPVGIITLKAYHQGGNVVIEVGDDGAGLPRNKILAKARERGLSVSDQMSDQEIFALIFEAGFSTADQVTDVSGRGVGMDVVRRNIQALGGRVEIESMLGVGTRITVRLPLTLAILDGLSVAVGNQTYILPLTYVIESIQPRADEIKTLSNQGRVIQVRGEYLPVLVLHEVFNLKSAWADFTQGIMIVVDADGTKVALFVDALVGQHQVVIKSLEANYRRVVGVSGATIMGDGHVALILDVPAIAGMTRLNSQKAG